MRTKTAAWQYGMVNFCVALIMIFGLFGVPPVAPVAASPQLESQLPEVITPDAPPAYEGSRTAQFALPVSRDDMTHDQPADHFTYQADRQTATLAVEQQATLSDFFRPATPAGISANADFAFAVDVFYDVVWSWGFPANNEITLTVGTESFVRTSDENGNYEWGDLGHDFVVGETITLTSGVYTKSHKVQKLSLTGLDQVLDIVKGTTKPGVVVSVWARDNDSETEVSVTSNAEGVFKAKMAAAGIDLTIDTVGNIGRWDSDGDGTVINWEILNPHIRVYPDNQDILGFNWWPATLVNLSIDGVSYGSALSDPWGLVEFHDITEPLTMGRVVVMTDGKSTRTHQITGMSFDLIDPVNDSVSGTASEPGFVKTYAWSPVNDEQENVDTSADSSGKWTAQYTIDIVPGSDGGARQFDAESNQSVYYWYLPNPGFEVKPDEDSVWGWEWPPLSEIKLTVNGDEYFRTSKENGDVDFSDLERDIVVGDTVEMSEGSVIKTHTVHYLTVEDADTDTETLSGYTEPGASIGTWVCTNGECQGIGTDSDPVTGYWEVDYSGVFDILPGSDGGVHLYEDDNTATMVYWRVPDPWIAVNMNNNYVWFDKWGSNDDLKLFIDGDEIATAEASHWGNGGFWDIETEVGQEVTVTGGGFTKSTIVRNITLGGVDPNADTVFGMADPGSELEVWVWNGDESDGGAMYTTTDSSGHWLIDFSDNWDIKPGWHGYVQIHDPEHDFTEVSWDIPMPWFEINIVEDAIWGGSWTPGSAVTVTAGTYTDTMTADEDGNVGFGFMDFDLAPGFYVEMTDGITTKSLTAYNLGFTSYDLDLDTLTGTADPGTWAHAVICMETGCNEVFDEEIGDDGVIFFDFNGIVDIQSGTEGWFDKWDDDGDNTVVTWRVPDPNFSVNLQGDVVNANRWPANANLTLKINSDTFYSTADFWGNAAFEGLGVDIIQGDLLEMTDGITTKKQTIPLLEVTDVDWQLDLVTGNTNINTDILVSADYPDGSGNFVMWATSDELGAWSADFSGDVDIVPGTNGWVALIDEDNDVTWLEWHVPAPRFGVNLNHDYIWGDQWEPGSTVTVNVRGTDVTTQTVSGDGIIDIGIADFNIQPGDTVTVRDDDVTKSLLVRHLALTRVDHLSDQVSGTAEPGSEISSWAELGDGLWHGLMTTTDGTGKWLADFAGIGADLDLGDFGYVNITEDDGDFTEVRWNVYAPFYPAYEEKLITSKVTFDWDDVPDAIKYKIQLSTKADFSTLVFSLNTTDSTYAYGTKLANNTTYYWRVRPLYADSKGSWLPVWKFTSMDPLAKPVLQSPAHKETIAENTPTLNWDPVVNGVQYLVQISKVVDFSTTYFKATTSETEFETNPLPNGKYFWRIRALDASGGKGPWSEVRLFKIAVP